MTETITREQFIGAVEDLTRLAAEMKWDDTLPLEAMLALPNDPIAGQSLLAVPDVLNTFRRNTELSVQRGTHFMARKCRQVKGWPDICSCLLYTSPSPRDATLSRMPSSA